jgi:2,4-dienoyl-CoA reductase (NADPH2)
MKAAQRDGHHIEHPFRDEMLDKLWEPVNVGTLELKNRIALAPIQVLPPENVWPDMHETHILFHETIAKGGAGLIVIGEVDVTPDSQGAVQAAAGGERRPTKGIWSDDAVPGWARLIDACHKWGAKVIPQLSSYADWRPQHRAVRSEGKMALIVPSWDKIGMTPENLEEEIQNFVNAAVRAKQAGADGVEIAGTRESLVASLVSPIRNPGTPGFSEGLKERVCFPTECIRKIKEACGTDFPVFIRITAVEYYTAGYDIDYAKQVAKEYVEAGIDAIDVVQAGFSTQLPQLQMVAPPGLYGHNSRDVKSYLASLGTPYSNVAIMNACRIQNPWLAASLLRNGDCDIVSICRQLMIDPEWPEKIRDRRIDDIIPCIGCSWCMRTHTCAVNPQSPFYKSAELTKTLKMTRAETKKKVVVVGGGMAGMEASRTLASRGHKVVLYEKEKELGRKIYIQSLPPFREDMDLLRIYLSKQIIKLGVEVRCGIEVTSETVVKDKPDAVVIATGCRPVLPEIPGIEKHPNVVFAEDVLLEKVDIGKRVVVIDAEARKDLGSLGSFTADYVARSTCVRDDVAMHIMRWSPQHSPEQVQEMANTPVGRQVTIVTTRDRVCDVEYHHYTTVEELRRLGVNVIMECQYKEITEKGLLISKDGKEEFLEADTIITANYESDDRLYRELEGNVPELYLTGDARAVQVQFIGNTHGAYRLALTI